MDASESKVDKPLFQNLSADNEEIEQSEIESLCLKCHEKGITRLLLTKIPFFKDVIVSSFSCPHCGHSDSGVQSAEAIQKKGLKVILQADPCKDLNRKVIKTEATTIRIPELDFEIPPESQRGSITTIEGTIDRAIEGLKQEQPIRRALDPDTAVKIDQFIEKLESLKTRKEPFTFEMDDLTGNCYLENPLAPTEDPKMSVLWYNRTPEQNLSLGLSEVETDAPDESIYQFRSNCPNCNAPVDTNMKMVDIPHFKQVIVMATTCDGCGERSNEIKSGTGFEEKGKRITLNVKDISDLNRDVLKSETCSIKIPELEVEIGAYALSGKFTTIEGLLGDIKDNLLKKNPFVCGDSIDMRNAEKLKIFGEKLDSLKEGKTPFTLILDDPVGNSYLQNVYAPEEDPEMKVEEYERTFEQNEELGLNDMKV